MINCLLEFFSACFGSLTHKFRCHHKRVCVPHINPILNDRKQIAATVTCLIAEQLHSAKHSIFTNNIIKLKYFGNLAKRGISFLKCSMFNVVKVSIITSKNKNNCAEAVRLLVTPGCGSNSCVWLTLQTEWAQKIAPRTKCCLITCRLLDFQFIMVDFGLM